MDQTDPLRPLRDDLAAFCASLQGLEPSVRLARQTELRRAVDQIVDLEVQEVISDLAAQGWGLRPIARVVGVSHEHVRRRLTVIPTPSRRQKTTSSLSQFRDRRLNESASLPGQSIATRHHH